MKLPSRAELLKKNDRELARLTEEIRRHIADCDEQRRKSCGALEDIRRVQAQRRIRAIPERELPPWPAGTANFAVPHLIRAGGE